jgi:hypothetical protein
MSMIAIYRFHDILPARTHYIAFLNHDEQNVYDKNDI